MKREDTFSQDPVPYFEIVNKAYSLHIWEIPVLNLSNHIIINYELSDASLSRDKHNHCLKLGPVLLSKDFFGQLLCFSTLIF